MLTTQYQSLSSVEEYILTVLDGNELYGLDILAAIASGTGGRFQLSAGTLYPTLRRLEKEGLVQSRWGDQEEGSGGARRKYYRQTPKGAAALGETQKIRAGLVAWAKVLNNCFR
jgi:PadR family transcriptional regulator, regulatory protein PadR